MLEKFKSAGGSSSNTTDYSIWETTRRESRGSGSLRDEDLNHEIPQSECRCGALWDVDCVMGFRRANASAERFGMKIWIMRFRRANATAERFGTVVMVH
jgi:hypothetical protein